MRKKLALQGIKKMLSGLVLLGLFLFLPAGTIHYPDAWRMICTLFMLKLSLSMHHKSRKIEF